MTRYVDITRRVDSTMICWPGHVPPEAEWRKRIERGDYCNASFWRLSAHTGTHADAPLHFVEGGRSIDQVPLEVFVGDCVVVDVRATAGSIMDATLAEQYRGQKRVLIRTGFPEQVADGVYPPHGPLMTPEAAAILLEGGLLLIGTDRLSVDVSGGGDYSLHHILLGAGCIIVEGLLLTDAESGRYGLSALPLRLGGGEASPIRAVLRVP
jgi:arylformamidase